MTNGELIERIYDLPERELMGLAAQIKQRPNWCQGHFEDFPAMKNAFERILDIRGAEHEFEEEIRHDVG